MSKEEEWCHSLHMRQGSHHMVVGISSAMAAITPTFTTPLRREATHLLGYSRSRPRFKFHLAIDAVLSMALALGAFQLATAPSRHSLTDALKNSGAVAFSARDLEKFVKDENLVAYWAGPQAQYKYTLIATTPGEITITSFPINADIRKVDSSIFVVQTHMRNSIDQEQIYSGSFSGPGSFLVNQGSTGNAIQYNPTNPTSVLIDMQNQMSTVTVSDSVPDAALSLAMKPGLIQKVSKV